MDILEQIGFNPEKMYLGKPCKKAEHLVHNKEKSLRYISNNYCVACHRDYSQRHKERLQQYARQYRDEHQEELKEDRLRRYNADVEKSRRKQREYDAANPERIKAQRKRYREWHRERLKLRSSEYYQQNRDAVCKQKRDRYQRDKDLLCEKKRQDYQSNPNIFLERNRLWRKNNSEHLKVRQRRRIARKRSVHAQKYSATDLGNHFKRISPLGSCIYCQADQFNEIDHFLPISLGGSDTLSNLLPVCKSCNCSKRNSDPHEWYKRQPFFSDRQWRYILKVLGKTESNYNQLPLL